MKREEVKKDEQKIQTEQKDQAIIRVRSGLRAGAVSALKGCADFI
jgi:hypothetical protein